MSAKWTDENPEPEIPEGEVEVQPAYSTVIDRIMWAPLQWLDDKFAK